MTEHAIPYDFGQARDAAYRFQSAQLAGEKALRDANDDKALKEKIYRIALAKRIIELHASGVAWTVCQDLARGDEKVAELRYDRDVAVGVFEATQTASWRHTANRKDCLELIVWSRTSGLRDDDPEQKFADVSARRAA